MPSTAPRTTPMPKALAQLSGQQADSVLAQSREWLTSIVPECLGIKYHLMRGKDTPDKLKDQIATDLLQMAGVTKKQESAAPLLVLPDTQFRFLVERFLERTVGTTGPVRPAIEVGAGTEIQR